MKLVFKVVVKIYFKVGVKWVFLFMVDKWIVEFEDEIDSKIDGIENMSFVIWMVLYYFQGMMRMGMDFGRLVINEYGEYYGVNGLFVVDVSFFFIFIIVNL